MLATASAQVCVPLGHSSLYFVMCLSNTAGIYFTIRHSATVTCLQSMLYLLQIWYEYFTVFNHRMYYSWDLAGTNSLPQAHCIEGKGRGCHGPDQVWEEIDANADLP